MKPAVAHAFTKALIEYAPKLDLSAEEWGNLGYELVRHSKRRSEPEIIELLKASDNGCVALDKGFAHINPNDQSLRYVDSVPPNQQARFDRESALFPRYIRYKGTPETGDHAAQLIRNPENHHLHR